MGPAESGDANHIVFTRSNSDLFSLSGAMIISGTWPNCTVQFSPNLNKFGTSEISITVSDGQLSSAASTINLEVLEVNDSPVVNAGGLVEFTEGGTSVTLDDDLTVTDVDSDNLVSATVPISNNAQLDDTLDVGSTLPTGIAESITGNELTLSGTASVADYQAALRLVTFITNSNDPTSATRTITWVVNDGSPSDPKTSFVNVVPVNDAPALTGLTNPVPGFEESNGTPVSAGGNGVTITDEDSTHMTGATIKITGNLTAGDVLNFTAANGISGAYNAATGALILSGTATKADYKTALESVTFSSTSNNPTGTGANRTLTWTVNDGSTDSAAATTTVSVTPENDKPVVVVGGTALTYTENATAAVINASITLGDDDDTNLEGATVSLSNFTTGDTLTFTPIPGKPVSVDSNEDGALTLTSTATVAQYEAALKSVTFSSSSNNPTENHILRTVTWQVFDGNDNSDEATSLILISPVNDAPTGTVTCSSLATADVYISGVANGAGWSLNTCAGATDPEGDTLTYQLDHSSTGTDSSGAYPCPTPIQSAVGGTSVAGNFPSGLGVFGSCEYKLKACDTNGLCTAASANSVIVSSYQINVSTPATPTLSAACVVESSSTINVTANLSNVTWQANTNAPSSADQSASVGPSFPATATFSTDITADRLDATFLPTPPTKSTSTAEASATVEITAGTLAAAIGNPPTTQITTAASSSAPYTITRTLEALLLRSGDAQGAADTYEEIHVDGQQPKYVTTAGCQTCTNGPIASISTGDTHTCVVESSGSTKCSGNNAVGQLGLAAGSSINAPPATVVEDGTGPIAPIAVSASKTGEHACAITTGGSAYCWGKNTSGQLGDDTTTNSDVPVIARAANVSKAVALSAGVTSNATLRPKTCHKYSIP